MGTAFSISNECNVSIPANVFKHVCNIDESATCYEYSFVLRMYAGRVSFVFVDEWGTEFANGSWNGMVGMLQRREIDIGGTPILLRDARLHIIDHVQLYTRTK